MYRSSFLIVKWDLNDQDFNLTKAEWAWADRTAELPKDASPGSEVTWLEPGKPADYAEPTRAGFKFAGWSTDKSASAGGYIDGSSPKLSMPEGAPEAKSYTLYALWTPLEYSVVFDLAKNPENGKGPGSDASYALNWESADGVRTVISLGNGRFRVDGFTMREADYDEVTRTVGLPEPSRTGYRFLGWSEPDGQSLAIDNAAKDGFALNPVRLTQIDGTPVLTARWASAFGVTAPLSITFGDYDKTGAPGNPWLGDKGSNAADDTTQSEADDTTKSEQEGYEALGQAYFENTGWHEAVKVVGLTSERYASANEVLTTYDSKQASEAAVLGDGTEENPGERLLSLYPSASAPSDDKSSGVHFRLTDAVAEADLGSAFTMAPQGEKGAKLPISYGLNLSTDPTDGSANHGLVLPTNDYERKQIATVSYTFATATAAYQQPTPSGPSPSGGTGDSLWIEVTDPSLGPVGVYGLDDIKEAASDLAAHSNDPSSSGYYDMYKGLLDAQVTTNGNPGAGPYFQLKVDGVYLPLQLIGICQDTKSDGSGKAGLTFQMRDIYAYGNQRSADAGGGAFSTRMNSSSSNAGGWNASNMKKTYLQEVFRGYLDEEFVSAIAKVDKRQQEAGGTNVNFLQQDAEAVIWLPSTYEVFGNAMTGFNESEGLSMAGFAPFQYQAYPTGANAIKRYNDTAYAWWLRTAYRNSTTGFCLVGSAGDSGGANPYSATGTHGIAPAFCL